MGSSSRVSPGIALAFGIVGIVGGARDANAQTPPSFAGALYPGTPQPGGMWFPCSGDFNGDGLIDFAGSTISGSPPVPMWIMLSNGTTWAPAPSPPSLSFATQNAFFGTPLDFVAADLNNDGKLDLGVSDTIDSVQIFHGDGAGNFTDAGLLTFANPAAGVNSVAIHALRAADVSADGITDLVVGSTSQKTVGVRLGTPQGGFAPPFYPPSSMSSVLRSDLGEFNGDGILDYALAGATGIVSTLEIALGAPAGGIASVATTISPSNTQSMLVAGDLNGDGRSDLLVRGFLGFDSPLHSQLCDGTGGFAGGPVQLVLKFNAQVTTRVCDLNADGLNDILHWQTTTGDFVVLLNLGNGTFGAPIPYLLGSLPNQNFAVVCDADGDGRNDVVKVQNGNSIVIYSNRTPYHAGIVPFGVGTHGCAGIHGANTNQAPSVSAGFYRYTFTNAPPSSLGLGLATDVIGAGGPDPFGLGIDFLVGFVGANEVYAYDIFSDLNGNASAVVALPNNPFLVGKVYYLQGIFLTTGACKPSQFGLSSSRGLIVTIQP